MSLLRRIGRFARRLLIGLAFVFAFVLPPFLVIMGNAASGSMLTNQQLKPVANERALPPPPAYDPSRKTALVVAGNTATESSDLLGPYEVLATSLWRRPREPPRRMAGARHTPPRPARIALRRAGRATAANAGNGLLLDRDQDPVPFEQVIGTTGQTQTLGI
jgi:hypothetical protein